MASVSGIFTHTVVPFPLVDWSSMVPLILFHFRPDLAHIPLVPPDCGAREPQPTFSGKRTLASNHGLGSSADDGRCWHAICGVLTCVQGGALDEIIGC